jgi:NADH:ubiquinone oxidoreductase subunit K
MISSIILLISLNFLFFFAKKVNLLKIMMFFELMLLFCYLIFLYKSNISLDASGIIFTLIALAIAACESAIGLSLFTIFYHEKKSININQLKTKGDDKWYSAL